MIEIKHKITGKTLKKVNSADLQGADLRYTKTIMCTINFSSKELKQAKQFIEGLKNQIKEKIQK